MTHIELEFSSQTRSGGVHHRVLFGRRKMASARMRQVQVLCENDTRGSNLHTRIAPWHTMRACALVGRYTALSLTRMPQMEVRRVPVVGRAMEENGNLLTSTPVSMERRCVSAASLSTPNTSSASSVEMDPNDLGNTTTTLKARFTLCSASLNKCADVCAGP